MKVKIDKMFAFVCYDPKEQCEGIMGFMPTGQAMFMPLVGGDWDRVKSLKPVADKISAVSGVSYRILEFSTRRDVTDQF